MITQLINEPTYNAYTTIPVAVRTTEMQYQIEAYEAQNNLNVDDEIQAPDAPESTTQALIVEVDTNPQDTFKDAVNDDTDASVAFIDTVEQDPSIAKQMEQSLAVLDDQLSIADERYKNFLALAAKATCLVKWTGPFILDVRVGDITYAKHVANTLGLLSFKHFVADSVLNKEIKEKQLLNKYLTICSVPTTTKRDSAVAKYDEVKKGCQFVVHTTAMKYVHNDDFNIGKLEDIFSAEQIEKEPYSESSIAILRVRLEQQEWVENNEEKIVKLVTDLKAQHKAIAPKVKVDTFNAWSGILVLAALWDKAVFKDMVALMNEQVGTQGLEVKEKLACALTMVVPEYEALMTRFNADLHITTKLVGNLVKGFGLTDTEVSQGFTDLGIPMNQSRGGYELSTLKAKIIEVVKYEDQSIQAYLTKLQKFELPKVA